MGDVKWTQLLLWLSLFVAGCVAGTLAKLTFEQATSVVFFLVGLGIAAAGIALSLWIAQREEQSQNKELRTLITAMHQEVHSLHEFTVSVWQPAMNTLLSQQPRNIDAIISAAQRGVTD